MRRPRPQRLMPLIAPTINPAVIDLEGMAENFRHIYVGGMVDQRSIIMSDGVAAIQSLGPLRITDAGIMIDFDSEAWVEQMKKTFGLMWLDWAIDASVSISLSGIDLHCDKWVDVNLNTDDIKTYTLDDSDWRGRGIWTSSVHAELGTPTAARSLRWEDDFHEPADYTPSVNFQVIGDSYASNVDIWTVTGPIFGYDSLKFRVNGTTGHLELYVDCGTDPQQVQIWCRADAPAQKTAADISAPD